MYPKSAAELIWRSLDLEREFLYCSTAKLLEKCCLDDSVDLHAHMYVYVGANSNDSRAASELKPNVNMIKNIYSLDPAVYDIMNRQVHAMHTTWIHIIRQVEPSHMIGSLEAGRGSRAAVPGLLIYMYMVMHICWGQVLTHAYVQLRAHVDHYSLDSVSQVPQSCRRNAGQDKC